MPQIKKTKIELKSRRDALKRFERFLPLLQLKKQQLQIELQAILTALDKVNAAAENLRAETKPWLALLAETAPLSPYAPTVDALSLSEANIAGVVIPVFESVRFKRAPVDLFTSPPWIDEALERIMALAESRIRAAILQRQADLLAEELRTTSQRVNLFEKVKIPEAKEQIRVIKIFLGDLMTAEVARGKAAKKVGMQEAGI